MGLIAMEMPSDSYYASGSFSHLINPPAIHLVIQEDALKQAFSLYKGSGGQVASLLSDTPSGANTKVFTQPENKLGTAVSEICMAFGLTKEELAQVCHVQSRKTLYNWINGDAKPRRAAMTRIFDLLVTARAWLDSGYVVDRAQLHEPVLDGHSVFDFLNQQNIDKERILFAGSRLTITSLPRGGLQDPFA